MVSRRHKVFISYYHEEDQEYANALREFYGSSKAIIDKSMYRDLSHLQADTILTKIRRDHLLDSTVTVVLVGKHTWGRKWVDWEIDASLRPYGERTRNGLVGIFLPEHSDRDFRLTDNIESGYAVALHWEDVEDDFIDAAHAAFNRRRRPELIDNSRKIRINNAPLQPKQYSPRQTDTETCPIALAFSGTVLANYLVVLRSWRDKELKTKRLGRLIVKIYYKVSPAISKIVSKHDILKYGIRLTFTPIIIHLRCACVSG